MKRYGDTPSKIFADNIVATARQRAQTQVHFDGIRKRVESLQSHAA